MLALFGPFRAEKGPLGPFPASRRPMSLFLDQITDLTLIYADLCCFRPLERPETPAWAGRCGPRGPFMPEERPLGLFMRPPGLQACGEGDSGPFNGPRGPLFTDLTLFTGLEARKASRNRLTGQGTS